MLGDLDLIHHASARDRAGPSAGAADTHRLSRMSLDSNISTASTASGAGGLSQSWGGAAKGSFFARQFSGGGPAAVAGSAPSGAAPVSIPGRGAAPAPGSPPAAAADMGALFRRHSLASPYAASPAGGAGASAFAGAASVGGGGGAAAMAADVAARHGGRMPSLVRSLSKGLSQSLDFR